MNTLIWFQKNLRAVNNPFLINACKNAERRIAVNYFDFRDFEKKYFGFNKTSKFRAGFLLETVANLQKNLVILSISLPVYHQKSEGILPKLVEKHDILPVFPQKEWTPLEQIVIELVKQKCPKNV